MIEEAIRYPRTGDDATTTLLVGGVLTLLSVLVVPGFFLLGYLVRVLRATEADEEAPPTFDDWGDLLVDGVKAFIVVFAYTIVPTIVVAVLAGGAVAAAVAGDLRAVAVAGTFLGLAVGVVLWLLALYVVPAALSSFASQGRLAAAFDADVLSTVLLDGRYATGWLVAFAFFVVAAVVIGVLNVVPVLGFVVGAFVDFYVAVAAAYLYGHAFADISAASVPPGSTSQPAV